MAKKRFWISTASMLATAVVAACVLLLVYDIGSLNDVTNGELVVPRGSPVWFSFYSEYDGGSAHVFVGDITVSGTYYYGYEMKGGERTAFIVPDDASAATLPHWKKWGLPRRIDLVNADNFAKAVLPGDVIANISGRNLLSTRGHITIVANGYEVTGECDQPVYLAKFKSVYRPKEMLAAKKNTVLNCG